MARPIEETPTLYGKDAIDFLNSLDKELTKKEEKYIEEMFSQRNAPF
ncbi:hypothetical protein [Methanobrevibacter sp.]